MNIDLNNWDNILLIGDPVILFILKKKEKMLSKKILFPIEYCLYNLVPEDRTERINNLITNIEEKYSCKSVLIVKSDRIECIIDEPYQCIVIYTHIFKDINDVLDSQSIDCRCIGYDGTEIHTIDRFDDTIHNYEFDKITIEDYLRMLYYKEYGFKFQTDQIAYTFSTFNTTFLKNHSIAYIYKNNKKFIDILTTVTKYYKTLKLESVHSSQLEYENLQIYYYYEKINYDELYHNRKYNYLITSDDLADHHISDTNNQHRISKCSDQNMCKIKLTDNILDDMHVDDILLDNVQHIKNNGFDLSGRSPLYISLLYRSVKSSLYLYEEHETLDLYNDMNSMHIICKEGLTDLVDLSEDINEYRITDEFKFTPYMYTLIFNKYKLFKILTDKFQNNVDFKYLLNLSIILKRDDIAMSIIRSNFDINSKLVGEYPLHTSIKYENLNIFNALINNGADLYSLDSENNTPIRIVMNKINESNKEIHKNMLNILLDKKIDLKKDFFFENLLKTSSEWMIDNIITKYHDYLDIKHNNKTLLYMVKVEINKLMEHTLEHEFTKSEVKKVTTNILQLNCMKYLQKLLEINHVQDDEKEMGYNDKKCYFISFDGYKKDSLKEYNQYTDLFSSIWDSNLNYFKSLLLDNKLDLNIYTSETHRTLLNVCLEKDSVSILKFILDMIKSSISNENECEEYLKQFFIIHDNNNNLILYAFRYNSIQCLHYLLNSPDNVIKNIVKLCLSDNRGFLKYALINQNIELVSYLLRMHMISELPSSICSEKLMRKLGIDDNSDNIMLDCIQCCALKSLFYMIKKLPTLINESNLNNISDNIFKADYVDLQGKNYLHHVCTTHYEIDQFETVHNIVKMFHKMNNKLINQIDNTGKTPIFYACVNKDHTLIQLLLQLGAETDIVDEMGWGIIHYLVSNNIFVDKKKISVFTKFDSTILNSKTLYEKQTPLILAAKVNIPDYVNLLIKLKVNTRSVDILGNMYTHYIMYNGSICARDIKIDCNENNFGMTPLECLEVKIKKELFNKNFYFVSSIIDIYDKHSKIYTHRVICKNENMIKMRQNFIKLIDNQKLFIIQNLVMP